MHQKLIVLLCLLNSVVVASAIPRAKSANPQKSALIKRVYVTPVNCKYPDCWESADPIDGDKWKRNGIVNHGNVHLDYADGRKVQVTKDGNVLSRGKGDPRGNGQMANPQISPDSRTVGWTIGKHQKCTDWSIGGTMFVNSQLVLYRDGKVLHVLSVSGTFIEGWRFWNKGKYVAVGSRWHHGLGYCRLFDVATGKLLQRIDSAKAAQKKLAWANDLTL